MCCPACTSTNRSIEALESRSEQLIITAPTAATAVPSPSHWFHFIRFSVGVRPITGRTPDVPELARKARLEIHVAHTAHAAALRHRRRFFVGPLGHNRLG